LVGAAERASLISGGNRNADLVREFQSNSTAGDAKLPDLADTTHACATDNKRTRASCSGALEIFSIPAVDTSSESAISSCHPSDRVIRY